MGSRAHFNGQNKSGTHTTVTEGAKPVIETLLRLYPLIRITNGVIQTNVKARTFSVKLVDETGAKKMTVVTNGAKQEFYLFDMPDIPTVVACLRNEKKLRNYYINT